MENLPLLSAAADVAIKLITLETAGNPTIREHIKAIREYIMALEVHAAVMPISAIDLDNERASQFDDAVLERSVIRDGVELFFRSPDNGETWMLTGVKAEYRPRLINYAKDLAAAARPFVMSGEQPGSWFWNGNTPKMREGMMRDLERAFAMWNFALLMDSVKPTDSDAESLLEQYENDLKVEETQNQDVTNK